MQHQLTSSYPNRLQSHNGVVMRNVLENETRNIKTKLNTVQRRQSKGGAGSASATPERR